MSKKLETLVKRFKAGKIAPHVYVTDGASRDPECSIRGCNWCWADHLESTLLRIVKDAAKEPRAKRTISDPLTGLTWEQD